MIYEVQIKTMELQNHLKKKHQQQDILMVYYRKFEGTDIITQSQK